jgi:hypothetical protein
MRARLSHRRRGLFGCRQINVGNGNAYALGRERSRDDAAETATTAKHESGLTF